MEYKKKLIEVAMPLQAINEASQHEKSVPRKGHPATLHLYWARRPLAAVRATILATLLDAPDDLNERDELLKFISELIKWKNTNNKSLLDKANKLIKKSVGTSQLPSIYDPFCGGGTVPLEAQRLGLQSFGSDINPLSVLLTKVMIEENFDYRKQKTISPNLELFKHSNSDSDYSGIKKDILYYGNLLSDEVYKEIGDYFPKIKINNNSNYSTIVGWLWANTVRCNNPVCEKEFPLVKSFQVAKKKNKNVWIVPHIIDGKIQIKISMKENESVEPTILNRSAKCLFCSSVMPIDYLRKKANQGKMDFQLLAIIAEGDKKEGRVYIEPDEPNIQLAKTAHPKWRPSEPVPKEYRFYNYGAKEFHNLFTERQLLVLTTFVEKLDYIKEIIIQDGNSEIKNINDYANLIITYLSFAIDKLADWSSKSCSWINTIEGIRNTFSRQSVSFSWDFIEINPFSNSAGNYKNHIAWVADGAENIIHKALFKGTVEQKDVSKEIIKTDNPVIITDPPYYDNIFYSDLSDYFYVWLKVSLKKIYPDLFNTIVTPKEGEIVASSKRHGGKKEASQHFLNGLFSAAKNIINNSNSNFPIVYYYAFKQTETKESEKSSTGWEVFLDGLIKSNHVITSTWPVRTERAGRTVSIGKNALASSIIITARKRSDSSIICTRREFIEVLSIELDDAVLNMISSDISPVDLQQSAIGPGMAVFTRYAKVLEADGTAMSVRTALQIINGELDRIQENSDIEMDSDTRFCIQWFDTYGFEEKPYGDAETLAQAKDISVSGLVDSGVFIAEHGKAKLKHWSEMPADWDPRIDKRLTLWECTHHMVRELIDGDGQLGAARLAKYMGNQKTDEAKELAYQLYHICDKRSWAKDAGDYNTLVSNWADIKSQIPNVSEGQETLF